MNSTADNAFSSYISEEALFYLNLWLITICLTFLSAVSMLTNAANQVTLIRQGLGEHVTFTLYCLSQTDFLVALCTLIAVGAVHLEMVDIPSALTSSLFSWLRVMFSDIAVGITVFLALEHSCCVAFPFAFKTMFNVRTSRIVVLCIALFVVINYIPVFSTFCLHMGLNPYTNATGVVWCRHPMAMSVYQYIGVAFGTTLSFICEVSTQVAVLVMHICLTRSAQVRYAMRTAQDVMATRRPVQSTLLSKKEEKAVRMVLVVAIFFLVSNFPKVVFNMSLALVPGLTDGTYPFIGDILGIVSYVTGTLNGCFHLVVFYSFNSSFRITFRKTFCLLFVSRP